MHQTSEAVSLFCARVWKEANPEDPQGSLSRFGDSPHQRAMAEKTKKAAEGGEEETVVVSKAKLQDLQQQVRALQAAAGSAPTTAA